MSITRSYSCIFRNGHLHRSVLTIPKFQIWTSTTALGAEMPQCDFTPEPYAGPPYEEVVRIRSTHISPVPKPLYKRPLLLHQGHKQWLFDHENRRYLDMFAGIVTISVGHSHPKVVEAAKRQVGKLTHTSPLFINPSLHEFAEKLQTKMPGDLKVIYFCNSGTDANDLAFLMAKVYTGANDVISLRNSYHGISMGLQGLAAFNTWRYNIAGPAGIIHTMNPDPYRGPWGGRQCRDSVCQTDRPCDCTPGQCQACNKYLDQLDDVLNTSVPKGHVAAFIAESIQGVGGAVQFPKNYLRGAFERIRAVGGLCISDEVQTGFARTGTHYWGFEGHDVLPDIVTMAKGIANGLPLSAVVTTPQIAARLTDALHLNTFGGNPVSTAVASAVFDIIEEEKLQSNAHEVGTYLLQEAEKLKSEFHVVGDVRGKGLMTGVELVKDQETKEPLGVELVMDILEKCKDLGVIVGVGGLKKNTLRIKPPLCVTKADVDFTIACLRQSLPRS